MTPTITPIRVTFTFTLSVIGSHQKSEKAALWRPRLYALDCQVVLDYVLGLFGLLLVLNLFRQGFFIVKRWLWPSDDGPGFSGDDAERIGLTEVSLPRQLALPPKFLDEV